MRLFLLQLWKSNCCKRPEDWCSEHRGCKYVTPVNFLYSMPTFFKQAHDVVRRVCVRALSDVVELSLSYRHITAIGVESTRNACPP